MNDPVVLLLFLATWGGVALLFRRLADDFRKATVRQSEKPAQIDEELLRITGEVQETIEGLSDAMSKRAEQLRVLLAEADNKIAALADATTRGALRSPEPPSEVAGLRPAQRGTQSPEPPARPEPAEPQVASSGRAPTSEVLRLAAEGHDPDTIARLTNRGREEVRLLLGSRH